MSETVRSYSGGKLNAGRTRPRRRHGLHGGIVLIGLMLALVGLFWMTRDSHPVAEFLPTHAAYHIAVPDVLAARTTLAQSPAWARLMDTFGLADARTKLNQDLQVPDWVLNNLVPNTCHVLGNDLNSLSDVTVVTRMSRIGCLLEKARFFFGIGSDPAGGLNLRYLEEPRMYYAVRGRVFLASLSRHNLVELLTLEPDASLAEKAGENDPLLAEQGGDIRGTVIPAKQDLISAYVRSGSFLVTFDDSSAVFKLCARLAPALEEDMSAVFSGLAPRPLAAPPDGMLSFSANLGVPLQEWPGVYGRAIEDPELAGLWQKLAAPAAPGTIAAMFSSVLAMIGPFGPGVCLSWVGVDLNEMIPVPQFVMTVDAEPDAVLQGLAALPAPPEGAKPWDPYARVDAEQKRVRLPLIGGPSLQPAGGAYGGAFLLGTSSAIVDGILGASTPAETLPQPGNIYLDVKPGPCMEAVRALLETYAEAGLLRDFVPGNVADKLQPWLQRSETIRDLTALASYENGTVSMEIRVAAATP